MYNIIQIGEHTVPMLSMASIDVYYRNIFGEDPVKLQTSKNLDEGDLINFLERMGFVMAKFAEVKNRKEMAKLNEDAFLDWLDQFERGDYLDALGDIRLTYEGQLVSRVDAKKNNEEPTDN